MVLLLDVALPQHDGTLAAMALTINLGRLCGIDLCHGVALVLVRWAHPGLGDVARPVRSSPVDLICIFQLDDLLVCLQVLSVAHPLGSFHCPAWA